jgi:hypothetical protein
MAPGPRVRRAGILRAAAFAAICTGPYLGRLAHPSIVNDDVLRIVQVQIFRLDQVLFIPFNEHIAPLFQAVTWAVWHLAGKRLENAPLAFTLASFAPLILSLWLLHRVVRRETDTTTAAVAVATFSLTAVHAETVYWYSASSLMWALAATLAAWLGVAAAQARGDRRGWVAAAVASAMAPAFSGIGMLAGPLAAMRALTGTGKGRWVGAVAPAAGTVLYLLVCLAVRRSGRLLSGGAVSGFDVGVFLASVARAPVDVLGPGLVGLGNLDAWMPRGLEFVLFGIGLVAALAWARRSPSRPLIAGGLWLILGGYGLTYSVRTIAGPHWLLEIGRYHLFPQLGVAFLVAAAARPALRRLDDRPRIGPAVAFGLAALLLAMHVAGLRDIGRSYRYPHQRQTLAAIDRLGAICRARGITYHQAVAALDPVRPAWAGDKNAIQMVEPSALEGSVPQAQVRPILLAALPSADRQALYGGTDFSRAVIPVVALAPAESVAVGRLVCAYRVEGAGVPGLYATRGSPSFLEFELGGAEGPPARALCVPGGLPGEWRELWWAGQPGRWSEGRSIRWQHDPSQPAGDRALLLDRLPHWAQSDARRVRLVFHTPGSTPAGAPRLLR